MSGSMGPLAAPERPLPDEAPGEAKTPDEKLPVWDETRRRQDQFIVGMWLLFLVAALFWEASPGSGIVLCPFRGWTGYSCPGCGMTRSCTAFVHLDLWHALSFHPLGPAFTLWLTVLGVWRAVELRRRAVVIWPRSARGRRLLRVVGWAFGGYALLFGAVRLVLEIVGILTPV